MVVGVTDDFKVKDSVMGNPSKNDLCNYEKQNSSLMTEIPPPTESLTVNYQTQQRQS